MQGFRHSQFLLIGIPRDFQPHAAIDIPHKSGAIHAVFHATPAINIPQELHGLADEIVLGAGQPAFMDSIICRDIHLCFLQGAIHLHRDNSRPSAIRTKLWLAQGNDAAHLEEYLPASFDSHSFLVGSHHQEILGLNIALPMGAIRKSHGPLAYPACIVPRLDKDKSSIPALGQDEQRFGRVKGRALQIIVMTETLIIKIVLCCRQEAEVRALSCQGIAHVIFFLEAGKPAVSLGHIIAFLADRLPICIIMLFRR